MQLPRENMTPQTELAIAPERLAEIRAYLKEVGPNDPTDEERPVVIDYLTELFRAVEHSREGSMSGAARMVRALLASAASVVAARRSGPSEPSAKAVEAAFDDMASALQRYANLGDFAKVQEAVRVGLRAAYAVDFPGEPSESPVEAR